MSDMNTVFSAMTELDDDILRDAEWAWEHPPARRRLLIPALASAACAALIAAGAFTAFRGIPAVKSDTMGEKPPVSGRIPDGQPDTSAPVPPNAGEDAEVGNIFPFLFNDVDAAPVGTPAMIALAAEDFLPMSAEESLEYFGIRLPEGGLVPGFELTGGGCFGGGFGVYGTEERGVYYDVNSYLFTGGGKSVTLTLQTTFNVTPSPEQVKNGPEKIDFTEFRGWNLVLFRYTDENGVECVYTEFVLDGVTCCVRASGLGNTELASVLWLLPEREYSDGPVTATGTVTAVDSRYSDSFDGTKHHYSEEHDYITVDCGDQRLTVWLPGEADSFSVGDTVTITWKGEPATAYNIWPGQLISVE